MARTETDSIDFGGAAPGAGQGLAMRGQIAAALFGEVAQPVCIGRFEVVEEIGAGGMGVVYRARDPKLDRDVAIKVVHVDHVSARGRARLVREAQTLARLNHPHVVTVYEVGEHEEQVFVAMEFVAGVNVREWIRSETRSPQEVLEVFLAAGRGLAAAHREEIVHRDFKPANVLLGADGRVRVADFGLARDDGSRESTGDPSGKGGSTPDSGGLTRTGAFVGTPTYMAPEQWAKKRVTAATDQFAYCVSLWEGLAGTVPFERDAVKRAGDGDELGAARGADSIPARLRKPLLRGLSADPQTRWPSIAELVEALEPRRGLPWRGFAVVAVAAGLVGAAVGRDEDVGAASEVSPCAPIQARMDKLWSQDERTRLKAAHEASAPFAKGSWPEIDRGLARYATAWSDATSGVCDGEGPVDPAALSCLEQSSVQLSTFTARIGDKDANVVSRLPAALATLDDPRRCASVNLPSVRPTPAVGSKLHPDVVQARELVDEAKLSLELGDYGLADERLAEALELARATEFLPVVAEAQLVRAKAEMGRGNAVDASAMFHEALTTAQQSRHDEAVLQALVGVLHAGAFADVDRDVLEQWRDLAEATLERLGWRPDLATDLDEARLDVLRLTEQPDAALELARDLYARGDERSSWARRQWARRQQGHLLADLKKTDEAEAIYRELIDETTRRLGPDHPDIAKLHSALGILHGTKPDVAAEHFEAALEVVRVSLGEEDIAYARNAVGLGLAKLMLGEIDEAKDLAEAAAEIQARLLRKGGDERNGALILLANVATVERDYETAIGHWKGVIEVTDPRTDRDNYAMAHNNVGYWYRMLGKLDECEPYYARLLELVEPGSQLDRYARMGLAAHRLRNALNEDARALLVVLDRPALDREMTLEALELWPLWALLDGASEREWELWDALADENGEAWLKEEIRETREKRADQARAER